MDLQSQQPGLEELFLHYYGPAEEASMTVLVRKELRDQRRALIGWGGRSSGMVLLYSSFWPSVRDNADQFESYLESLPDALRNMIGELSIATPVGYLQSELFSFLGPASDRVFAIGAGARASPGRRSSGRWTSSSSPRSPVADRAGEVRRDDHHGVRHRRGTVVSVVMVGPVFDLRSALGTSRRRRCNSSCSGSRSARSRCS